MILLLQIDYLLSEISVCSEINLSFKYENIYTILFYTLKF